MAKRKKKTSASLVALVVFGFLCILTSFVFNSNTKTLLRKTLPAKGGLAGPFKVEKANTVIQIDVKQRLIYKFNWIFNTCEVLDEEQEYLTSFGKEFWWESGYDEGYWEEKDQSYSTKITIPYPGIFYLNFLTERSPRENANMTVKVYTKMGSGLPLMIVGIAAIVLSIIAATIRENM